MQNRQLFDDIMTNIESVKQKQLISRKIGDVIDGRHNQMALGMALMLFFIGTLLGNVTNKVSDTELIKISQSYAVDNSEYSSDYSGQNWLTNPIDEYNILAASY